VQNFLSDEEFVQVFKMDREQFSKQPAWKRENLKRELKLF